MAAAIALTGDAHVFDSAFGVSAPEVVSGFHRAEVLPIGLIHGYAHSDILLRATYLRGSAQKNVPIGLMLAIQTRPGIPFRHTPAGRTSNLGVAFGQLGMNIVILDFSSF